MVATLHHLHPSSKPLAGFLRIGHTGQIKLEALHAAGRFPYRRVVFDAAHLPKQLNLLKLLKASAFAAPFRGGGRAVAAVLGR